VIETSPAILYDLLSKPDHIIFADSWRNPVEEVAVSNIDMSVNRVTTLHRYFPVFDGNGMHVSVKENRPDTADIDFKGRYEVSPFVSPTLSSHATVMATLIAGRGNSFYEGKGVAHSSRFSSVNFANLLPEPDSYYQQFLVSVQNHSYGTAIENYYGADARAYDASVVTRPSLLHVFSAGNSGQAQGSGTYAGITGYANTTGSFKMSKNSISVGHTDSSAMVVPGSSRGPAYDGRVMPSLVAFGEDGSSGAAAIVSGIATTLHHAHKIIYGSEASSALIRALLFNSADDAGVSGIDYTSGFGLANGFFAMRDLSSGYFTNGSVSQGGQQVHNLIVPGGLKRSRVILTWNDLPATANAPVALVNDLDIELREIASGTSWQPWVLSHFPHTDSLEKPATRKKDDLNNAEQVTVDLPAGGNYEIIVKGSSVQGSQSYSLAWHFDTLGRIDWLFPTKDDEILGGRSNMIRWNSTFAAGEVDSIQVTLDNGISFQTIARAPLDKGFVRWEAPDTFHAAYLLIHAGTQSYLSELFTISKRIDMRVGFNCPDSFSLYWQKVPGATGYRLSRLGQFAMEPFLNTVDTFVVLQKSSHPSMHYAVTPLLPLEALRSYAYDYSNQGVGCYLRTFIAQLDLSGHAAQLMLELGTSYGIQSIAWEKWNGNTFVTLSSLTPSGLASYQFSDPNLVSGINLYRVRIRLFNGAEIFSSEEPVIYFDGRNYIVYPNPVRRGETLKILNNELDIVSLRILDAWGREVKRIDIDAFVNELPGLPIGSGIYFLVFRKKDGTSQTIKLAVR
jgi:hypothetical protein